MKKALIIFLFVILLVLPPLALIIQNPFIDIFTLIRATALISYTLMSFQFMLASRIPLLEQQFGQDKLLYAHRICGMTSVILLFAHGPVYLFQRMVWAGGLFLYFPDDMPIVIASIGFVLLLMLAGTAAFRSALRIPYDKWKYLHRLTYVLYPVFFLHAMILGTTIRSSLLVYVQFLLMFALVLLSWVWRIYLYIRSRKRSYLLSSVSRLNHNVTQFAFAGPEMEHKPGQFAYLRLKSGGKMLPAHPFTISSSPVQSDIAFTVKSSGDFTSVMPTLSVGAEAHIEGPYGRFSYVNFSQDSSLLWIAGGVGITPMLSMLRLLRTDDPDRAIILLWGNKTAEDVFLQEELIEIQSDMRNLTIVHVFSQEKGELLGEREIKRGHIDRACIREYVNHPEAYEVFLCGPPNMVAKLLPELKHSGFQSRKIHTERFGF